MLIVSPQWFFKGNGDQDKFYTKFSYSLYRAFAQNPDISDETKAYVRQRCAALGVDANQLAAASKDTPVDVLNDLAYAYADSCRLRTDVSNIINLAPSKTEVRMTGQSSGEPDWQTLLREAKTEGQESCTNNDFGVYDAYWEKNHQYMPESSRISMKLMKNMQILPAFLRFVMRWVWSLSFVFFRYMGVGMTLLMWLLKSVRITISIFVTFVMQQMFPMQTFLAVNTRNTSFAIRCIPAGLGGSV